MYIYPDNLAAKATLWLWELKDLAIIGIGFLIGIFSLVRTGALLPLALVVAYGFLSIRFDNTSILDFIRYAAAYFLHASNILNGGIPHDLQKERVHTGAARH